MGLRTVVGLSLGLAAFLTAYHLTTTMTRILSVPQKQLLRPQGIGNGQVQSGFRRRPPANSADSGSRPEFPVSAAGLSEDAAVPKDPYLFKKYVPSPPPPPPGPSLEFDGPAEWADGADSCHVKRNAEYDGQFVVHWGDGHLKNSAEECCQACKDEAAGERGCNVWVWCGEPEGCWGRKHKECWLKHQTLFNPGAIAGRISKDVPWTSGAVYTQPQKEEYERLVHEQAIQEQERLDRLRMDLSRPMVYLDVEIKGEPIGRITIVLFNKEAPRAAENYRALCTGEKGVAPRGHEGAGRKYWLKGAAFYRIIDRFIIQTGANTDSVFGGTFKDDPGGLEIKHEHKGLLSMANAGPDSNTSHSSILLAPAPHLDGKYTVFGQVVEGMEVVEAVNALSKGKPENTANASAGAVIVDAGQIRPGTPFDPRNAP